MSNMDNGKCKGHTKLNHSEHEYVIENGSPVPMGVTLTDKGINFAIDVRNDQKCSLLLYEKGSDHIAAEICFPDMFKTGDIMHVCIRGIDYECYNYDYCIAGNVFHDPYARRISGCEVWGKRVAQSAFYFETYDWEEDQTIRRDYHENIMYLIHVRGFTKHATSEVQKKGTFAGITEKIPYLLELGINQIELMPAYDFEEIIQSKESKTEPRVNYWGYAEGFFFSPKASYSGDDNPQKSMKDLVKELHKNGIEIILQFYFPEKVLQSYIIECIRYWISEYHIDGIHLKGSQLPIQLITTDPFLKKTKILYENLPLEYIYEQEDVPSYKNLAEYNDGFMNTMRKYLKSDDDMLEAFVRVSVFNPEKAAIINYITNYAGFTLMDLVSFDQKRNLSNGENNRDGTDYNYSWNCGTEGSTRKKAVLLLRRRQIRNALIFLFLSQGVPLLLSGDEFGNSQNGNNNPYCQDNDVTWLNWSLKKDNTDIFEFVKTLIKLRKEHPIFHPADQLRVLDYLSCGYPDVSYHGEMAWFPKFENYNRHIGIMYCGQYAKKISGEKDDFFYIAYNMHWEIHRFALPKLPKKMQWYPLISTKQNGDQEDIHTALEDQSCLIVPARTIIVITGH